MFGLLLVAASSLSLGTGVASAAPNPVHPSPRTERHFVYVQSNDPTTNEVIGYRWDGSSTAEIGSWSTGGQGTGFWLGSQGAVAIDGNRLYAVNGASNDVSMFSIEKNGALRLLDREAVAGLKPVSVTVEGNRVVVLSVETYSPCGGAMKCAPNEINRVCAGASPCGRSPQNRLTLLRRHHDSLEAVANQVLAGTGGAQVSFADHPHGKRVIVTEKVSNTIVSVAIKGKGFGAVTSIASVGANPYGFAIAKHDTLVVSNAEGEQVGAGTVSSYSLRKHTVTPVTSSLPLGEQSPCWVALGKGGKTAYVSNADSNTISLVSIGKRGALTLLAGSAGPSAAIPTDLEVHGDFLFVNAWQTLQVHRIAGNGTISVAGSAVIPSYAQGIAVK